MTKNESALFASAEREIGLRGGFHDFIEMAWPLVEPSKDFQDNWHIHAMAEHLEAVTAGDIRKLVINVPPGCMKSLTVQVFWHPWVWIRLPGHKFFSASFDTTLTRRDAGKSLAIIQSRWFQERWGDKFKLPADPAVGDYTNNKGGFRFSTSVNGKGTGRHCDTLIIDDPTKPQSVGDKTLESTERWFRETLPTRFHDLKTGRKVIIMQRLHEKDLAGIAIEEGYDLLRLPMRYEPKACWSRDPRKEEGELLWEDRFPEEEVKGLEKTMGAQTSAAQLQQSPSPAGGAVFQRNWFKTYATLPASFDAIVQSWDCTFKDLASSDWVVGQVWGRKGPDYYLLDQVRERMGFAETCKAIKRMALKWPKARTILIEDKANGSAVIETMKKEISGIVTVNPEGGKEARANACTGVFEAGNVLHPEGEWVKQHQEELARFPKATHDDTVDACTQALIYLQNKAARFLAAMAKYRGLQTA